MKRKIFTLLFLAIIIAGISSCKKNEEKDAPCTVAWATEVSDEANAMSTALQAYATDQSPANCNAYKQAAQAYLNALKPYGDCTLLTGQQRIALEKALSDTQESVDNMEC